MKRILEAGVFGHRPLWSCLAAAMLIPWATIALASPPAAEEKPQILGRPVQEAPLARVGEEEITSQSFEAEMRQRGGELVGQFATAESRRELLDQMLLQKALLARAKAEGYESHPEMVALLERAMIAKLLRDQLEGKLEAMRVSTEEVEAFYSAHQAEYAVPARSEAAIVFVAVPKNAGNEERARLRARAEEALAAASELGNATPHFGEVARQFSDDRPSRVLGGKVGWISDAPALTARWDRAVTEALFALETPGQLTEVIETSKGFYLVKLMRHEERRLRPVEALREGIRARLLGERRQQERQSFFAATLESAGIRIDQEQLAHMQPPSSGRLPEPPSPPPIPSLPGSER